MELANGIIHKLLEAVIGAIRVPLKVLSIEGDAVFRYGSTPEGTLPTNPSGRRDSASRLADRTMAFVGRQAQEGHSPPT